MVPRLTESYAQLLGSHRPLCANCLLIDVKNLRWKEGYFYRAICIAYRSQDRAVA